MKDYLEFMNESFKQLMDDHRHIAIFLESHWGTEQCHDYFLDLLNKRLGPDRQNREGFNIRHYKVLLGTYMVHLNRYGDFGKPLILDTPNVQMSSLQTKNGRPQWIAQKVL